MDVRKAGNLTSTNVYYMYQVSTYPLMLSALLRLRRIKWLAIKYTMNTHRTYSNVTLQKTA